MATIQQLERALIKADAAGDEQAARTLAAEIKRMRAAGGKKPKAPAKAGVGETILSGIRTGLKDVMDNIPSPLNYIAELTTPKHKLEAIERGRRQMDVRASEVERQRPITYSLARAGGQLVPTLPAVSLLGAGVVGAGSQIATKAPRAGQVISSVGRAVQTGGVGAGRTAAQTARMTKTARAAQLAQRAAGGGIAGAAGAALTDQDISEGAMFGAGLPVVASVLRRLGGKVVDITRMPRLKAAQIIREALGDKIDEARAAFAALSPDDQRLARQVLVDADVEPRVFMGLGEDVERLRPDDVSGVLENQAAARNARLASAAGGSTATEQRAAVSAARKGVNEATGPVREEALSRANVAGRVVPQAEAIAEAARAEADRIAASGFVPRMRGLEERAGEQAQIMGDMPAIFPDMERIQQTRGIAGAAGQRAEDAMQAQIGLRDTARDMETIVADLAAEGMQPLKVGPIVAQIRNMANKPGTRASTLQRRALTKAANQLEALGDVNGVIDARDLYQFRKSELGDIVDVLLSSRSQPPSGVKEGAAELMGNIRTLVDDAIQEAGGANWKDYLTRTRQGFAAVNRQELGAKGAQLAKEKPNELIALMAGERPQVVEDIMGKGTGQYDIEGLALADPRRYLAMKDAAKELNTLNRMRDLGREGAFAASELAYRERPSFLTRGLTGLALFPSAPARIAAQGAEMATSGYLAPRVRNELANAFLSGRGAINLIDQYPASLEASEQLSRLSPGMRNAIAQLARQYALGTSGND